MIGRYDGEGPFRSLVDTVAEGMTLRVVACAINPGVVLAPAGIGDDHAGILVLGPDGGADDGITGIDVDEVNGLVYVTTFRDMPGDEPGHRRFFTFATDRGFALDSGFTTVRDLGTEGALDADVGLRQAVAEGVVPGPRLLISNRALVATGSYGPKGFASEVVVPQGAEEADGPGLVTAVRRQIGAGADWIKVYADYRWGPNGEARPTYGQEELALIVATARPGKSAGEIQKVIDEELERLVGVAMQVLEEEAKRIAHVLHAVDDHGVEGHRIDAAAQGHAPARLLVRRQRVDRDLRVGARHQDSSARQRPRPRDARPERLDHGRHHAPPAVGIDLPGR